MYWTLPLCLLLAGSQLSSQDLVTMAPSEEDLDVPPQTSDNPTPTVKPTIRALHVFSDIKYRYATTLVSSRVVNSNNQSGEASFTLTLPESAFISEFLMDVKGKVYKAYVKEKKEAKATYDQAVAAGQFAGHVALDARDSNQFTVSVNIEAHGKVTFNLTYEQLLKRNLGVYSNVINIDPQQIVEDMSVEVNIIEPTEITDLEVPEIVVSNEAVPDKAKPNALAKIEDKSPEHKTVVWAPTPAEQKSLNSTGVSGQFIVRYDVNRENNPQQVLVDEGYFVHFFSPESLPKLRKHVVFVLDFSGSMAGRKLEQLKDAMNKILSDLGPKDFFSIVIFESFVQAWSPKKVYTTATRDLPSYEVQHIPKSHFNTTLDKEFVVEATAENIATARAYIANFTDLGATNIMGGLRTGLQVVNIGSEQWINESDPPQPVMVFLTDGQPNVEEYDTDRIIDKTKPLNTKQCPIFSLAFGYGADFNFLRKLSLSNFGFARNIYEAADASQQLENFYKTIASPLLSNVTFSYLPGQVDNSTHTKVNFPVFFGGSEMVVAGKMSADVICPLESEEQRPLGELSGTTANGFHKFPIVFNCVLRPDHSNRTNATHLEKTWAYLTIQQLLDKADALDNGNEKNQTQDKALKLALQYSFVTPLTSLVVVKPNETESAVDTTKVQPGFDGQGVQFSTPSFAGFNKVSGGAGYGSSGVAAPMNSISAASYGSGYPAPPRAPAASYPAYTPEQLNTMMPPSDNPPMKIAVSEVLWLQQYLWNTTADYANVTVNGAQYSLSLNQVDQPFGACQVDNSPGECHHFKFCALDVFKDDVQKFIPYQCSIGQTIYLGVCCPSTVLGATGGS